jgi:hypothetical protein
MYLLLVVVAILIILAILFVDWQQMKEYYPTLQYYIICNLLYNFIFYQHPLWSYNTNTFIWFNHTFTEITFSLFIIPLVIVIFLRFFPAGLKGIGYILVWVITFWLIEYLFSKKGNFLYDNGWNIWWSLIFNMIMFPTLRLHFKRPLIAILVSIPLIIILLMFFHPSLDDLK